MRLQSLCVYCGSSPGARPEFTQAAQELGEELAIRGIRLIYGGGNVGLMGRIADAALARGGAVIGVIPHHLADLELAHTGATEMHRVNSMHERKAMMAELSDGFIAMPGGIGTLEELFEVMTWLQLGLHPKPVGLLNVAGFYDGLLWFLDHLVDERFLRPEHRAMLISDDDVNSLLHRMETFEGAGIGKWLDREEAATASAATAPPSL
jgi:uncharacterized protein (TIGR00730 family)